MTEDARRPLPRWKKALLGLLVTCLFFGALELMLAICGVRPVLYDEDPFVGFAEHVPLFVEHTAPDGREVWRTANNKRRWFNLQEFPRRKPPNTTRIFCMGGSTTYGRPYDDATSFCGWLRILLPVADPSRQWEVVNAGGLSYASYRVAHLMEECARYEPDLFIVYCGHNEFLERRTYGRMLDAPGPLLRAATALTRTRTGTAIHAALRGLGLVSRAPTSSRDVLPGEVDAILDHTVGPADYHRDDAWAERVTDHYRLNLGRMIDIARAAGARIVVAAPGSKLKDCSPFKSEHRAGLTDAERQRWQAHLDRAKGLPPERALAELGRAAAIDGRHAGLHYRRGTQLSTVHRYAEARRAFERARDEDVCPLRATTPMHAIVTEVAADRAVPLVDFAGLVDEQAEHRIPGAEQFLDHIHPTVAVHRTLAVALVDALAKHGELTLSSSWNDAAIERAAGKIESRIDRAAQGRALRNLAKVLGWAGKFEESRHVALQAIELLGDDPESCFQTGVAAHLLGDGDQAAAYLRRAIDARPGYGHAHRWLGEALLKSGRRQDALAHFRRAAELLPDDEAVGKRLAEVLAADQD